MYILNLSDATPAELQEELLDRAIARNAAEIARLERQLTTMREKQDRRYSEHERIRDRIHAERIARGEIPAFTTET